MNKSELEPNPNLTIPVIPVICDRCRAEGSAGDDPFTAIADLLDFAPVPRRAHVNNWTPEHQRAFVAGLALTGSPRMAARALGRHAFGAEQLRTAKGGRAFADACDAALELYRERELYRIRDNLAALAEQQEQRDDGGLAGSHLRALPPPLPSPSGGADFEAPPGGNARWNVRVGEGPGVGAADWHDCPRCAETDRADHMRYRREHEQSIRKTRRSLLICRRMYLRSIADDPERRAAWELLCGPADWDAARKLGEQPDENPDRPDLIELRGPGLQVPLTTGFAPQLTDPRFYPEGDPLPQLERSIAQSDPRWNGAYGSAEGEE